MIESVARLPLVNYGGHDACQKLSLDRLLLVTDFTVLVRTCRQIACSWHRWPRCMLATVASSPLLIYFGPSAWQILSLDRLQLITVDTIHVRTCGWMALVNYGFHDACYNLSLDRYQLITVGMMHVRNCRQIAFSQSRCLQCMAESVASSHLFSHSVTMQVRNCRQIAFS